MAPSLIPSSSIPLSPIPYSPIPSGTQIPPETTLVAIDPGLRGCGVALGENSKVRAAAYVVGEMDPKARHAGLWFPMVSAVRQWILDHRTPLMRFECAIELPQIYKASHQRGSKIGTNPNDLIDLAAVVGGFASLFAAGSFKVRVYLPAEWKGQVPKKIVHDRARARLSSAELKAVEQGLPQASLAHNVWDAVSLFLRHVGR